MDKPEFCYHNVSGIDVDRKGVSETSNPQILSFLTSTKAWLEERDKIHFIDLLKRGKIKYTQIGDNMVYFFESKL